jgi:hypothetical protein
MIAFIRGIRTPVSTTAMAVSVKNGVEHRRVLAVPVAVAVRNRAVLPASCRSMARLRTA